jgi:hypothetical protein
MKNSGFLLRARHSRPRDKASEERAEFASVFHSPGSGLRGQAKAANKTFATRLCDNSPFPAHRAC